jgi:hypothetical protein
MLVIRIVRLRAIGSQILPEPVTSATLPSRLHDGTDGTDEPLIPLTAAIAIVAYVKIEGDMIK